VLIEENKGEINMDKKELRLKILDLRLEQRTLHKEFKRDNITEEKKVSVLQRLKEIDGELETIKYNYAQEQYAKIEGSRKR